MKKIILLIFIGISNFTYSQEQKHKIVKILTIKEYSTIYLVKGTTKINDTAVLAVKKDSSFILKPGLLYEFVIKPTPAQPNLTIIQDNQILWTSKDPIKLFPSSACFFKEVYKFKE